MAGASEIEAKHANKRISHVGSELNKTGIPETRVCRIGSCGARSSRLKNAACAPSSVLGDAACVAFAHVLASLRPEACTHISKTSADDAESHAAGPSITVVCVCVCVFCCCCCLFVFHHSRLCPSLYHANPRPSKQLLGTATQARAASGHGCVAWAQLLQRLAFGRLFQRTSLTRAGLTRFQNLSMSNSRRMMERLGNDVQGTSAVRLQRLLGRSNSG